MLLNVLQCTGHASTVKMYLDLNDSSVKAEKLCPSENDSSRGTRTLDPTWSRVKGAGSTVGQWFPGSDHTEVHSFHPLVRRPMDSNSRGHSTKWHPLIHCIDCIPENSILEFSNQKMGSLGPFIHSHWGCGRTMRWHAGMVMQLYVTAVLSSGQGRDVQGPEASAPRRRNAE